MNERIKELGRQAGLYMESQHPGGFPNEELAVAERFAELIIEECMSIYSRIDNGNLHMGTDNYLEALHKTFRS